MGLDPSGFLVADCPLAAGPFPRNLLIGRCSCGCLGCGDVTVLASLEGDVLTWTHDVRPTIQRHFDWSSYRAEITRAVSDHSWETPERTAARLLAARLDHDKLAARGITFEWASGRVVGGPLTISLRLADGPHQLLVHVPWNGETPSEIVSNAAALLELAPESWEGVQWYPQANGIGAPRFAGPGWRKG